MKTSELTGVALDWAVAKCEGLEPFNDSISWLVKIDGKFVGMPWYSVNWEQGGAIIERQRICLIDQGGDYWRALCGWKEESGDTPLIAAMRCHVAIQLGDEVDVPKELL
jgi:hypothetical protein